MCKSFFYLFAVSILSIFAPATYASMPMVDISSPVEYIQQSFDVIHYSAQIDLRNAPSTDITAVSQIKIYWTENPNNNLFYFHLRGLIVDSVKYDGHHAEFLVEGTEASATYHYSVVPPIDALQDTAIVSVYYHGQMKNADSFGGVFSKNDVLFSIGVGFSNNYVSSTQHWLACYDHPSDKATFDFTFITPKDFSVASNGIIEIEETFIDVAEELRRTKWTSRRKIATNLMTFACAEYVKVKTDWFYYPIVIYCKKQDSAACEYIFRKMPVMVTSMQNRFGKYLFDKVGYVITPLSGGAMEHQTMITMNESEIRSLYQAGDTINSTAVHELAHHWFGNSVTPYDYRDAWFNEGFATFAANTWLEENFGYERYLDGISSEMDYYLNIGSKNEGVFPLYDFPRVSPSSNYPITIYYKGCAVAAMLRYELGDSLFYNGLTKYLDSLAWANMTTAGFVDFWEDYTGRELSWFFNQWVFGKGYPELSIAIHKSKSEVENSFKAEIHISQVQNQDWGIYINLPVEMLFAGVDGRKVTRVFNMTEGEQIFYIDSLPDFQSPVINRGPTVRTLLKVRNIITSNDENDAASIVRIFPNPVSDILSIKDIDLSVIDRISISDVTGKELMCFSIDDYRSQNHYEINLSKLSCGSYYITLFGRTRTDTFSFIKI